MKKSELKQLIKECVQEILNEDSGSQKVDGYIVIYALSKDRFKEIVDKGNNSVVVVLTNGKKYKGVRYNNDLIAVSSNAGISIINADGVKLKDNEEELELEYTGEVNYDTDSWEEYHPYGDTYASEPMSSIDVGDAEVYIITALPSGINSQVEEFANRLAQEDAVENFELR